MQIETPPSPPPAWVPAPMPQTWPAAGAPPYRHAPYATGASPFATRKKGRQTAMRKVELAALAALVLALDVAFLSAGKLALGGYGLAIGFVATPVAMLVAAHVKRSWRGSPRLAIVAALIAAVAARCAFDPTTSTVLTGLLLVFGFGYALRTRRAFVPDVLAGALAAAPNVPSRIGALVRGASKLTANTRLSTGARGVNVVAIAVPAALCLVFLGVFALANPVVAHGVGTAWTGLTRFVGLPSFARVVLWIGTLGVGALLLRPAVGFATANETHPREGEASATLLLVARNSLGALNVLFFAYNALDAAYLWSGSPPKGTTTQEYAHQGAFWLTIALAMVTGVVGVMFRGPIAHDLRGKLSRTLAYVWMGQGVFLALGTYRRIAIHVAHSGLSDLRIVGILGTTLVVSGLVLVATKLRFEKTFLWLARRQLDAFAIAIALYVAFPTHLVSARINVARIQSGEYRPVLHMFRQASHPESAAAVLPLLDHPDLRVRQGVAALLADEHEKLARETSGRTSWRERDVASARTLRALDESHEKIAAVLGAADRRNARMALLEVSRVANEDRSLEEILAVPSADDPHWNQEGGLRSRSY